MAKIFDELLLKGVRSGQAPARTKAARKWYRNAAKQSNVTSRDIMRTRQQLRIRHKIQVGDMVFFRYDAKMKGKLPYWDAFPLIIPFRETSQHFYGLNLHYLPPKQRALLMDILYSYATDDRYDQKTRIALSYAAIKGAANNKYFKPCVKMYLKSHVKSRFVKVHASEWDMALFLPIADFQGASRQKVWADSRQIIRGN